MLNINDTVGLVLTFLSILALLAAFFKWLRPKFRRAARDIQAGRDALVGRDAVVDSITGKELAPALPGVGQRTAALEDSVTMLTTAMTKLADTHVRLESHDRRIGRLEQAASERTLARTESIEMLRTMDTAFRAERKED